MDFLTATMQSLGSLFSWSAAKAVCAVILAAGFAHSSVPFLVSLVCIDVVLSTGIALHENCFTWPGFRHGFGRFLAYALIFMVTSLADWGIGISGLALNLTVGVSYYAIAGETIACLHHIDHLFPGRLPSWLIDRLLTFQRSIEHEFPDYTCENDAVDGSSRACGKEEACPPENGNAEEGKNKPASGQGHVSGEDT